MKLKTKEVSMKKRIYRVTKVSFMHFVDWKIHEHLLLALSSANDSFVIVFISTVPHEKETEHTRMRLAELSRCGKIAGLVRSLSDNLPMRTFGNAAVWVVHVEWNRSVHGASSRIHCPFDSPLSIDSSRSLDRSDRGRWTPPWGQWPVVYSCHRRWP